MPPIICEIGKPIDQNIFYFVVTHIAKIINYNWLLSEINYFYIYFTYILHIFYLK